MNDATISAVAARRVWDSRGRPTVEVEIQLGGGASGRAIAPAGASRGSREAIDLRDGGNLLGGANVTQAVANVNSIIAPAIQGMNASEQQEIDAALCELDGTALKSNLGANATVATLT